MTGALLKQLNAAFFISARKSGVCARNGCTLMSPRGALQLCTERESKRARGIRIKGHFFAGVVEALPQCGKSGTDGVATLRGGWWEFPGSKLSWWKPPSLPSHWWDGVCQLITESPTKSCAETQGRIF